MPDHLYRCIYKIQTSDIQSLKPKDPHKSPGPNPTS